MSWGCSECRGEEFEDQDRLRVIRNCDGTKPTPTLAKTWAPELRQCPWSLIDSETWKMVEWWYEWKEYGVLPYGSATLREEPAFVYLVITHCDQVAKTSIHRAREKAEKDAERERKKQEEELKRGRKH